MKDVVSTGKDIKTVDCVYTIQWNLSNPVTIGANSSALNRDTNVAFGMGESVLGVLI